MAFQAPVSGPRPKNLNGKVAFVHCFRKDPDLRHAFYDNVPKGMMFDATIVDFLIILRERNHIDEAGNTMNGRDFVQYLVGQFQRFLENAKDVVVYTDKHAPVAKAPTQTKRIEDETIPPAVVLKGEKATEEEYKLVERRQNKINRIIKIREQRAETKARKELISLDDPIPQPFIEFTGSGYRPQIMRFLISNMIGTRSIGLYPPDGKRVIVDGHWMMPAHYPDHIKESVGFELNDPIDQTHSERKRFRTTPLVITRPPQTQAYAPMFEDDLVIKPIDDNVFPTVAPMLKFANNMGEFDAAFPLYIVWMMIKEKHLRFEVVSTDSDCVVIALWFLYRLRNLPESFRLVYFDEENEENNTPEAKAEREKLDKKYHEIIRNYADAVDIWVKTCTGEKPQRYVHINELYDALVKKLPVMQTLEDGTSVFVPNEKIIPSVLATILSCASDYTIGYHGISMYTFLDAFYTNYHYIEDMVTFSEGDGHGVFLDGRAYYRLIKSVFTTQYRSRFVLPKKRKRKSKKDEEEDIESEPEEEVVVTDRSLFDVRKVVNASFEKKYGKYVRHPDLLGDLTDSEFAQFMRAAKNCIPPSDEIKKRGQLVAGMCMFVHSYGNATIHFPDPERFGFERIDKSQKLVGSNIRMAAKYDWGNWEQTRNVAKLAKFNPAARKVLNTIQPSTDEGVALEWDD